jgi:hypothetical protein
MSLIKFLMPSSPSSSAAASSFSASSKARRSEAGRVGAGEQALKARDGTFYEIVPDDVRKQGPRRGNRCGAVEALKPEYRLALARDGSMLVRCEAAMCKQEA